MDDIFDLVAGTVAYDQKVNAQHVGKSESDLTFKRDEHGILWSYDASGKRVGRIYEHGDDSKIDTIKEI